MPYTEANYENAVIELFVETLGYEFIHAPSVERDYTNPFFMRDVLPCLQRINKDVPYAVLEKAFVQIQELEGFNLLQKNISFLKLLQGGVEIPYYDEGEEITYLVKLLDFENIEQNNFVIANQWKIIDEVEKRPDLIVFVNGLPLVVIELKSPSREDTDVSEAFRQLKNYMHDIKRLFYYNAFCVMSDQTTSKAGTITASEDRFMEWKTTDGKYENTAFASFDTFFEGIFYKERLLDLIQNFLCFVEDTENTYKVLGAYHQYFAVKKAIQSTLKAMETDGKGGVFWHTQGSGKSLSMVFYAKAIQKFVSQPTIVVITDRIDLDNQLFSQFVACQNFLYQTPIQAQSREDLTLLLNNRMANGIIFTTMQKFAESEKPLSLRKNIIVMADEAHRSQYGLIEKIDKKTGKIKIGTARIIRNGLPNATFIGFTGTPISSKDRSTIEVFGNYIDVYDMTQAVEDGATRPVYYESRVVSLKLDQDILNLIDKEYDLLAQNAEPYAIEKSKKELGKLEAILGADETIKSLVADIIEHYQNNRQYVLTGKAMIVAYSRPIAIKIYQEILRVKPDWEQKIGIVMTQGNNDPEEWRAIIGNKNHKNEMAKKFKDNNDVLKIAIVVDMWLTGFDVPSLATMYVYKPMAGHNLMQAIARVNRVYKDKVGGLVVDYVGIAAALKKAMFDYTARDKINYGDMNIKETAYIKFLEKLEVCQDFMHGFDYSAFFAGSDLERAKLITGAVNFILAKSELERDKKEELQTKHLFIKEALLLNQALTLCSSIVEEKKRFEAAFFEAIRTMLVRFVISGAEKKFTLPEINQRINELLKHSIKSDGVINLFADIKTEFSLFDPKFLNEISNMKEKNLALEMLKKLIAEQVTLYKKTNLVKSEQFSKMIKDAMNRYFTGLLTNEQVIQELLELANQMMKDQEKGNSLGLSSEELAFYDALTRPQAVKDFYENQVLIDMTKELTTMLKSKRSIDWQQKESARADMRIMVKRLLKKYKYPPEGMEDAIQTVLTQCELWVDKG